VLKQKTIVWFSWFGTSLALALEQEVIDAGEQVADPTEATTDSVHETRHKEETDLTRKT
jgi:hypothetical protein